MSALLPQQNSNKVALLLRTPMTSPSTVSCKPSNLQPKANIHLGTPALLADVGGKTVPVKPMRFSAYYIGIEAAEVPIPQNYKTIAGNASATAQAQLNKLAGVQWFCEGDSAPASKEHGRPI